MEHSVKRILKTASSKLKGGLSFVLALILVFSCMGGSLSVITPAATTYPTYMVRVQNNGQNHAWWAQFGLELGSLKANSTYQLKYMVNVDTTKTFISNARNGYSSNVTVNSSNYDTNSRVRIVEFTVTTAGTYYLRYVQPNVGTPMYFAGFKLYNLTDDSAKSNNLLDYNANDIKGWSSNFYTATAGMHSFAQGEADVLRLDFNAATIGITVVEEPEEPEDTSGLPEKMVYKTGDKWSVYGVALRGLKANHNYRLSYYTSQVDNGLPIILVNNQTAWDNGRVTLTTNAFDASTQTKTIEFSITSAGDYFLKMQGQDTLYLAGFKLYDLTDDANQTKNLLNYHLKNNLKDWITTWYTGTSADTVINNDNNILTLMDFDPDIFGIIPPGVNILSAENGKVTLEPSEGYEYSCNGLDWQASNVFENLKTNTIYSFYRRQIASSKISSVTYLSFPEKPIIKLRGETKLLVSSVDGYEYSTDKINWYKTNDLTMLEPKTEHTVYQRLQLKGNVYEIVSEPTLVITDGKDMLDGGDAENLTYIRKLLFNDGICTYAADVNYDEEVNIIDLIRLKNNILYQPKLSVACYGDSITQGMSMAANKTYPSQLNSLLGDNYSVINGGDPGENSFTIAARQGAYALFTENQITYAAGQSTVTIGNDVNNGFVSANGDPLALTFTLGNQMPVNPIVIGDNTFTVSYEGSICKLTRQGDTSKELVIPKDEQVYLNSTNVTKTSTVDVYYIGANGGFGGVKDTLIAQIEEMIKYHGSHRYIVIIPHWTNAYDDAFVSAFGNHAVNLRQASIEYGLEFEGITPTDKDLTQIAWNNMPASLRLTNEDAFHLNQYGYHFLAHLIHERGQQLKLW